MKTKVVTIYFDGDRDLTTFEFTADLRNSHQVTRLDILQDAIHDLSEEYDKELKNE